MPNQEKKVMSAQTLHKRPPKLHLGHDERVHSAASPVDSLENLSEMSSCNAALTAMSSLPSTPTTPSTPNSPAISKPPKKRYLENGSFRSSEDHATPQMAKLMELAKSETSVGAAAEMEVLHSSTNGRIAVAKRSQIETENIFTVCSSTSKSIGSLSDDFSPDSNRDPMDDKQLGQNADFQVNVNYNHSKSQVSGDGVSFPNKTDISTDVSTYNQIPTFDVDIAGRIRDSDLFKTSSSSSSSTTSTTTTTSTRSEEPLNLCTDRKTITTCQQDLISRMVDKFFCDPSESKGTLLDSFLLKMNSHKKLSQDNVTNKASNNKTRGENGSDGEEVECVGRFKGIKFHCNDRIGASKVVLGNATDDSGAVIHCRGEKKDCFEGTENRGFLQKQSQTFTTSATTSATTQSVATKTVTNSEKTPHCGGDDFIMETITPLKEGQRKSPRSSKGKRYKAFLTEGFLQPSKDGRKQLNRNNSEEQVDCDKSGKDIDIKPSNKPNKKRKALEMRDEKGSTKERHSSDDKARENKGNCLQQTDEDGDVHRLRKAKRKNTSTTDVQESEKSIDENEEKPDYQYCCMRNTSDAANYLGSQTVSDDITSKPAVLCDTQKSQSDENQKKRPLEVLSNLNDDSDSPPKLTRMDEDNGFEGEN